MTRSIPTHHLDWQLGPLLLPVSLGDGPVDHSPSAQTLASSGLRLVRDDDLPVAADASHWQVQHDKPHWTWQTAATAGAWQAGDGPTVGGFGFGRVASAAHKTAVLEAALAAMWCEVVARGGVVLHAATLESPHGDDRAVVVAARSGGGKSTIARRFPQDWVNEEHAFAIPTAQGWEAWYLRQYRGQRHHTTRVGRLHALYVLDPSQREHTGRERLAPADALSAVLQNGYIPGGDGLTALSRNSEALAVTLPVYRLAHALQTPAERLAELLFAPAEAEHG